MEDHHIYNKYERSFANVTLTHINRELQPVPDLGVGNRVQLPLPR